MEFENNHPVIPEKPDDGFLDYLSSKCIFADGDQYHYSKVPLCDDSGYFLSPVRPVYRKRIKEAMLVAYHYGNLRNRPVVFVITHPDIDDKQYFMETVRFANAMGIQYIHLGEEFTFKKLNYVYRNFAALNTVGVVASSAGGWENALNELAASCIPFFMSIDCYTELSRINCGDQFQREKMLTGESISITFYLLNRREYEEGHYCRRDVWHGV